jgi:two-component system response regulator GlrR
MTNRHQNFDVETIIRSPTFAKSLPVHAERYLPEIEWTDGEGVHRVRIEGETRVGSAQGNDLRVADPSVSRVHARLELRGSALWVTDLGSRNGTFVGRVRVQEAEVPNGSHLRLGGADLLVSYGARPATVPLWPERHFGPLLGESHIMRELFRRLAKVSATDSTVLIQGETGTGKELVARAIHEASPRAKAPFIVVDCSAIPKDLMEAELFGHVKGAFTGAIGAREGAIEAADGGTVFFDEFGELPMALQPKLLRVIESRAVRRVGEAQHRQVDVRYIVATHRDLATMVNQGAFREDLYFRVAVVPVHIPPLRERPEDIPQLIEHFLPSGSVLDDTVLHEISKRPWLGNVRELRNFADRLVALGPQEAMADPGRTQPTANSTGAFAAMANIPTQPGKQTQPPAFDALGVDLDIPFKELRDRWLTQLEKDYILGWLERTKWNVSAVAERVGLDRTYVHRLIKKHDLGR